MPSRLCRVASAIALLFVGSLPASADRLPTTVVPSHYDLAFVVDLERARFEGTETIRVNVAEPTATVVLHALDLEFRDVTIGTAGAAQTASVRLNAAAQTATLTAPKPLAAGPTEIHARFSGVLNDKLRGFYLSRGGDRTYAVTQFESTDARRAFPSFDEPAFKATFAVTMTVPRGDMAISNGRVMSDMAGPLPTQHTVKFSTTPRMSPYLVAMAVGNFACTQGSAEGIPIRVCATQDKKDLTKVALDAAEDLLKFYNSYYAIKYPFGKLDVVAVPDFAAGAMENTAAIFYRETDLLADAKQASVTTRKTITSVLAHEMAHQWFGDLVTMKWWDDIWLNEGFATWMANRALAATHPEWDIAVDEALENQQALALDSLTSTHPIHSPANEPDDIDAAFDVIAYQKGGAVLRMIESYVGRENFRKGVNAYLETHAYGNAESADFWNMIAVASGRPVDQIMPTFVNQGGVPLLTVTTTCEAGPTRISVEQQRFVETGDKAASPGERWQIPWCWKAGATSETGCEVLTAPTAAVSLRGGSCAPWVFANAGARGYYRSAYPPEMLKAMAARVETDLSAPERLSLVADEWALVRAGRHSASDYLTLAAGFGTEHASGVLGEVVQRLAFIDEYLTTDAARPRFQSFTRSLFTPLLMELGFTPATSDSDTRRELRSLAVRALGTYANDPDIIAQSLSALNRALSGGPSIEPTLANAVVAVAAQHGDAALYDKLVAAASAATSPEDHDRYLFAIGGFRDPAIIERALQRTLQPDIRSQDAPIYLSQFFRNPVARPIAWRFVKERWTDLQPRMNIFGGDSYLVQSLGSVCDPATRDDVKAFLGAKQLTAAARALDQSMERINNCIALKDAQQPAVSAWLASR